MSQKPGADELRIRGILRQRGVGPDAPPATVPPRPAVRPRDWLDNILDANATTPPTPAEEPPAERPESPSGPTPIAAVKPPKRRKRKPS
ncbi:hypothetical protein O3Q52_36145, partial [Streptomyces sp. ActVer]|nr:hypothetical protein [Streptomyces sp. ActVer]